MRTTETLSIDGRELERAVRGIARAPVATPLRWSEVSAGDLHARKYTIANIFRRLGQTDDPWARIDDEPQSLAAAADRLEKLAHDTG